MTEIEKAIQAAYGSHVDELAWAAIKAAIAAREAQVRREALESALAAMWMESGRSMLGDVALKRADARIRSLISAGSADPGDGT